MRVDVGTWPKQKQYEWVVSIVWGKMVSDATCQYFAERCPDILSKTGMKCPVFDEADIARAVPVYLQAHPEHKGYEERLKWILRCIFSPGIPATPPGVTVIAPYVPPSVSPYVAPPDMTIIPPTRPPNPPSGEEVPSWLKIAGVGLLIYLVLIKS